MLNRKLSPWMAYVVIALIAIYSSLTARAATPYAGFYSGYVYFSISGTITQPESAIGFAAFSVDENGIITGNITGTVDGSGNITWDSNSIGFTTGTISGGVLAATTSQNNNGAISTTRIAANNNAGGFGNGNGVAASLVPRAPLPTGANMLGVTYGGGKFVAVGPGGNVAISGNGTDWVSANSATAVQLNSVAYGNNTYVAVGDAKTVVTSPDAINWTPRSLNGDIVAQNVVAVAFGNGTFVAVNLINEVYTSTDGISWSKIASPPTTSYWNNLKYVGGRFVLVGTNGSNGTISTSTDGVNWSTTKVLTSSGGILDIAYGNNKWVGVNTAKAITFTATDASDAVATSVSGLGDTVGFINGVFVSDNYYFSTDGITWTRRSYPNSDVNDMVTVGNLMVAVGASITSTPDGQNWTIHTKVLPQPDVNNVSSRVVSNNSLTGEYNDEFLYYNFQGQTRYVRVGMNGVIEEKTTTGAVYTNAPSPTTKHLRAGYGYSTGVGLIVGDGGTILKYGYSAAVNKFTNAVSGTTANLRSITSSSGNNFVVVGTGGTILYTSNGGASWGATASGTTENLNRVEYFSASFNYYIAVGDNGKILKSSNGTSWSTLNSGTTKKLIGVGTLGTTQLVVMAEDGTVIYSNDHGANWITINTVKAPYKLTFANSSLARGENGVEMQGNNGTNWSYRLPTFESVVALAQGNGRTIALGNNYAVSTDLDNWKGYPMKYSHYGLAFGKGIFLSVGSGDGVTGYGNIATSVDGSRWIARTSPINTLFYGAAYGGGKFVAVGSSGKIISSPDTVTWTDRSISGSQTLNAVVYGGGRFVAVGDSSAIRYSRDGETWSSPSVSGNWKGVAYGNGLFVIVNDGGGIRTSPDCITWTTRTSGTTTGLQTVSYTGTHFIAVGNLESGGKGAVLVHSTNGLTWTKENAFFASSLRASTAGSGNYIAGGSDGAIFAAPYQDTASPYITSEPSPVSQSVSAGVTVNYSVSSTGTGVSYQWYKDGTPLSDGNGVSGAATATLTLTGVDVLDTGVYQVAIYNDSGSDLSSELSLNVNGPPIIITHPVAVVTSLGQTTNFSVTAVGPGPFTYQWRKNGQTLSNGGHYSGTSTERLEISNAAGADEGTYDVIVTNAYGSSAPSDGATLGVNRSPTITQQPVGVTVKEGEPVTLSVVADGTATLTYQWKRGGTNLVNNGIFSGVDTPTLHISETIVADNGLYTVTVSNAFEPAATSTSVYVSVLGPGAFLPTFVFNASGSQVWDIEPTADGKFVIGGDFSVSGGAGPSWARLAKIDSNGALAPMVTTNAASVANSAIRTVVELPDRRLLAGGGFWQWGGNSSYGYTVRLSETGVLDTTFQPNPGYTVPKIIRQADGKILIARTGLGAGAQSWVARYNADGTKDNTFTEVFTSTAGQINSMVQQSDGTIWLGMLAGVKKINSNGTNPTIVSTANTTYGVGTVHLGPDDKIYYVDNNGQYMGRLNVDGSQDSSFNVTLDGGVGDMAFLDNGNIVIVGGFHTINTTTTSAYIAILDNTGAVVGDFTSPYYWVYGGALYSIHMLEDGSALLGGNISQTLPSIQKFVQRVQIYKPDLFFVTHPVSQTVNRFDPVTFTALGEGTSTISYQWRTNGVNIPGATSSSYTINSVVEANQLDYDVVITNNSGSRTSRAAHLTVLGDVFISQQPVSLVVTQNMTATFTVTASGATPLTYQWRKNGQAIPGATGSSLSISGAKVDDAANYDVVVSNPLGNQPSAPVSLSVVGSTVPLGTPGTLDTSFTAATLGGSSQVYGVAADSLGRVYVTGNFTSYNGQTRNRFFRLNADLSLDMGFAPSFNSSTYPVEMLPDGGFLVGGYQSTVDSTTSYGLSRFNSAGVLQSSPTLSNFGYVDGGASPNGIWVNDDGSYFIAGYFTSVNGTTRNSVAKVKADGTLDTAFAPTAFPNSVVNGIAEGPDGKVIIVGQFTTVGGETHTGLARYNADGSLDSSFQTAVSSTSFVPYTIGFQSDGKILVAGRIFYIKDNPSASLETRYGIARLNTDGTVDTTFNANLNSSVYVYDMIVQPDDKIIIVGTFTSVNGTSRGRIARLNADGTLDTSFATGIGANSTVYSIAQLPSGGYMIGGLFTQFDNDTTKKYLTKIHGNPPTPPALAIIKHPLSQTVLEGESVDFTVSAVGVAPLTFQWKKGTQIIPDATNASYHISQVDGTHAADYTVVVTDAVGNVTSQVATLTVSAGATFAAWKADKGLTPGLNDGYNDDADGDGVKNVVEYVFNTHPNQGGSKPVIEKIKENVTGTDYPAVRVIALKDLQDIDVVVEASTDANFSTLIPTVTTVVDQGNGTQQITIRTTTPFSNTAKVFFRFIIKDVVIPG